MRPTESPFLYSSSLSSLVTGGLDGPLPPENSIFSLSARFPLIFFSLGVLCAEASPPPLMQIFGGGKTQRQRKWRRKRKRESEKRELERGGGGERKDKCFFFFLGERRHRHYSQGGPKKPFSPFETLKLFCISPI